MIELYEKLSRKEVDICTLVLKSASIPYRVKRVTGGWSVWVDEGQYMAARLVMSQYFDENRDIKPVGGTADFGKPHAFAGLWMAVAIAAVYVLIGPDQAIWTEFGASAARITSGEIYRTVTALMLHADAGHLVGNMAGLVLFGTAVCQVTGWGMGTLMVLLTGITGNLINAFMNESGHLSIGASTAVFGAIGILSGYQFLEKMQPGQRRSGAWLPLAGGLALLGLLGSGAHVDLAAHLFGFIAGIASGMSYSVLRRPMGNIVQWLCLAIASVMVIGAWGWGMWLSG